MIFSVLFSPVIFAQQNATCSASANVVTEMAGFQNISDINFTDIQRSPEVTTITGYPTVNVFGRSCTYAVTFSFSNDTLGMPGSDEIQNSDSFETDFSTKFHNTQTMRTDTYFDKYFTPPTPLTVTINYN